MKVLIACLALVSVALATPAFDWRIINGQKATLGQFPWMAKIAGCSASVVNANTILTAAHCVCNRAPTEVEVGSVNSGTGQGQKYGIKETRIYPGYPTGSGCAVVRAYDFAILKTSSPISFNSNVKAISLFPNNAPGAGTAIVSMGYGGDGQGGSNVLNYANTVTTSSGCGTGYICSSRTPNSIYFGDSGGPLVIVSGGTSYQLGVNSGISSSTSLYANVPGYREWLAKNL